MFFFSFCSHKTCSAFSWSAKGKHLNLLVWPRENSKWEKMHWYPAHQYKWEMALSSLWLGPKILKKKLGRVRNFRWVHHNTFKMIQNFKRPNMLAIIGRFLSGFSVLQTQQLDKYKRYSRGVERCLSHRHVEELCAFGYWLTWFLLSSWSIFMNKSWILTPLP